MRRLDLLDGMRGYFLVFMLLTHLTFAGGYALAKINHAELGFVQDAQGFVFLSGLLAGMVYGRRMLKNGFLFGAKAVWRRTGEIYAYAIGCIVLIVLLQALLPQAEQAWRAWLGELGEGRGAHRLAAALLLYQPTFLDILPQYIVYMLVAPPLIWLCLTGRWLSVAIGSGLVWLGTQFGMHIPAVQAVNGVLAMLGPDLALRVPFNVFGWQIVFVAGLVFGCLAIKDDFDVRSAFAPERTALLKMALAVLAFFMMWRLAFTFELVPERVMRRFHAFENRQEFSAVFLVNFVAMAYVVTWLIVAGPSSQSRLARRTATVLNTVFRLRYLRLLGRHSLQVYAWHVVVVYVVLFIDFHWRPMGEAAKSLIVLVSLALLALPAFWIENRQRILSATLARPA